MSSSLSASNINSFNTTENSSSFVLDTADSGVVQTFAERISKATCVDHPFEDFVASAIAALEESDNQDLILERSKRIYAQMLDKSGDNDDGQSARIIADAWLKFTCDLAVHIESLGLRNIHGRLDFYFSHMLEDDIVVTRYS